MNTSNPNDRSTGTAGDPRTHVHEPYYDTAATRQAAGTAPVAASSHADASVGTLLKELAHEVPSLLRNEMALAKSEMREHMAEVGKATGELAVGGAVALAGLVVVLMALVYALSNVMEPWLAALLVGGAALIIGYMMVSAGRRKLANESLRPERTMQSLREDKNAIRGGTQ